MVCPPQQGFSKGSQFQLGDKVRIIVRMRCKTIDIGTIIFMFRLLAAIHVAKDWALSSLDCHACHNSFAQGVGVGVA